MLAAVVAIVFALGGAQPVVASGGYGCFTYGYDDGWDFAESSNEAMGRTCSASSEFVAAPSPDVTALRTQVSDLVAPSAGSSFYTVQSAEDAARLAAGGSPWPTTATRAEFGPGVYAWGNADEAAAYAARLQSRGACVSICEFNVNTSNLSHVDVDSLVDPSAFILNTVSYGTVRQTTGWTTSRAEQTSARSTTSVLTHSLAQRGLGPDESL